MLASKSMPSPKSPRCNFIVLHTYQHNINTLFRPTMTGEDYGLRGKFSQSSPVIVHRSPSYTSASSGSTSQRARSSIRALAREAKKFHLHLLDIMSADFRLSVNDKEVCGYVSACVCGQKSTTFPPTHPRTHKLTDNISGISSALFCLILGFIKCRHIKPLGIETVSPTNTRQLPC